MIYKTPPPADSELGNLCTLWESNVSETYVDKSCKQTMSLMKDPPAALRLKERQEHIAPLTKGNERTDESLAEIFDCLEITHSNCPDWNIFYLAHHLENAFIWLHGGQYRETALYAFCSRQPKILADVLAAGGTCAQPSGVVVTDALIDLLRYEVNNDRLRYQECVETYGLIMEEHKSRARDMLVTMLPIQESENPSPQSDLHSNQPIHVQLQWVKLLVRVLLEMAYDERLEETVENKRGLGTVYQVLNRELMRQKDENDEEIRTRRIQEEELYGESGQVGTDSDQPMSSVANWTSPSFQTLLPPPRRPPPPRRVNPSWKGDGVYLVLCVSGFQGSEFSTFTLMTSVSMWNGSIPQCAYSGLFGTPLRALVLCAVSDCIVAERLRKKCGILVL